MDLEKSGSYSTTIPLHDSLEEDLLNNLDDLADTLHRNLTSGRNVLVHCRMVCPPLLFHRCCSYADDFAVSQGLSRSASLVIAYKIKHFHLSFEVAREFVASKRFKINPNPTFVRELRMYEGICRMRECSVETRSYDDLV